MILAKWQSITIPELNKLLKENFNNKLKRANLGIEADIADFIESFW